MSVRVLDFNYIIARRRGNGGNSIKTPGSTEHNKSKFPFKEIGMSRTPLKRYHTWLQYPTYEQCGSNCDI